MREPATYQRCFPARSTLPLTILLLCLGAILLPVRIQAASSGRPDNPGFQQAVADYRYLFPSDHGSHDEFRTEWWYYTGHLTAENGRRFGYQVTFFRRGIADERVRNNPSRWAIRQLYLAHAALSDRSAQRFLFAEKVSRAGLGKAGAESERLHVWIDRWAVEASTPVHDRQHLRASAEKFSLDLTLKAEKPPIVHGEGGVSRKGEGYGQASHYYSLTRLATTGTVVIDGTRLAVTGTSWMDHEFGSGDLGDNQVGWDWFSIQLHNQTELMLYRLRRADGTADPVSSGTLIMPDGRSQFLSFSDAHIEVLDHWTSAASGARYPSRWRVSIPKIRLVLHLTPYLQNQELITRKSTQVTYWEGAVQITGSQQDAPITGDGYVELTGYAEPFNQRQ